MFSYIYADEKTGQGLGYFVVHTSEDGTNKEALRHIKDLFEATGKQASKKLQQALNNKNAKEAIEAWNEYSVSELNIGIYYHNIDIVKLAD